MVGVLALAATDAAVLPQFSDGATAGMLGTAVVVGIGALALGIVGLRRARQRFTEWRAFVAAVAPTPTAVAGSFGWLVLLQLLVGGAFHVVGVRLFDVPAREAALMVGSVATAWTLGFVTPGAPSGLGVREALLVSMLSPTVGAPNATGLALCFRAVTTLGDLIGFAAGSVGQRLTRGPVAVTRIVGSPSQ